MTGKKVVDDAFIQFWGGQPSSKDLKRCEFLGWARRECVGEEERWQLTLSTEYELSTANEERYYQRLVETFCVVTSLDGLSPEEFRLLEGFEEKGLLCRGLGDEGELAMAVTAAAVFCNRPDELISKRMRDVFDWLRKRGLMERKRADGGDWRWGPTDAGVNKGMASNRQALEVLFELGLGRLLDKAINEQLRSLGVNSLQRE
jgi:hypothetical protein